MKSTILIPLFCSFLILCCQQKQEQEIEYVDDPTFVFYAGSDAVKKDHHIVLVSGDEEYRSEEALPMMGKILAQKHGFDCTVLFAQSPDQLGLINPNFRSNIPGLERLADANLMILFTRFRSLPDAQMNHVQDYLMNGNPVLAIRTATHAFEFGDSTNQWNHWSNSFSDDGSMWDGGFGRLVLGEKWYTHHGHHKQQSTRGIIADADHPIATGLDDGDIWGPTDVYGVRLPLPGDAHPIVLGQVIDRTAPFDEADALFGLRSTDDQIATENPAARSPYNPNDPMMPIAWTKSYQLPDGQIGQSFTTTIGSSTDLLNEGVRQLWVNAVYHLCDLQVPAGVDVGIVGDYQPTAYNFHSDEYWIEKNLQVADFKISKQ